MSETWFRLEPTGQERIVSVIPDPQPPRPPDPRPDPMPPPQPSPPNPDPGRPTPDIRPAEGSALMAVCVEEPGLTTVQDRA